MVSIFNTVGQLDAKQYGIIKTAFQYQVTVEQAILLSTPSPDGYVYWTNDDPEFIEDAKTMLQSLGIKEVTR